MTTPLTPETAMAEALHAIKPNIANGARVTAKQVLGVLRANGWTLDRERRERVDPDPETGRMALALRSLGLTDEQVRRIRADEGDWLANTTPSRERVDPDLRARINEALGSLTDEQVMYDRPTSMTGPMDPVLFVEFDAFSKAILAATPDRHRRQRYCLVCGATKDSHGLGASRTDHPFTAAVAAPSDNEEREAELERIAAAIDDIDLDQRDALRLYYAGLRATPRPR